MPHGRAPKGRREARQTGAPSEMGGSLHRHFPVPGRDPSMSENLTKVVRERKERDNISNTVALIHARGTGEACAAWDVRLHGRVPKRQYASIDKRRNRNASNDNR